MKTLRKEKYSHIKLFTATPYMERTFHIWKVRVIFDNLNHTFLCFCIKDQIVDFDQDIGKIISLPNIDYFSAVEIRTAYLAQKNDMKMDKSDARRFVYSELVKLVNIGWLKKTVSAKKGITSYVKTELFDADKLMKQVVPVTNKADPIKTLSGINVPEHLLARLHDYKSALLEGLGEAEEYKNLRNEFPDMHESLVKKYNEVREKNTRLLGQIKAIENLIKQQK